MESVESTEQRFDRLEKYRVLSNIIREWNAAVASELQSVIEGYVNDAYYYKELYKEHKKNHP